MKFTKCVLLLFAMSLIHSTISAQTYTGDQEEIQKILNNIKNFSDYYMNADYDSLANAYTSDAKILPPGTDIIENRAAIKQQWILPEGVRILHHKITPSEIKIIGEYAYDVGYYEGKTLRANQTETSWKGKYIIIWKKEDGDWKIYLDAWNRVNS